jgi:hypothetical protein
MTQVYRTLRVAPGGEGGEGVGVDARPMRQMGRAVGRER